MKYILVLIINKVKQVFSLILKKRNKQKSLIYIHIGKCGGTSMLNSFKAKNNRIKIFHMDRPRLVGDFDSNQYLFLVRNPLDRFVSAFNYSKNIIEFDTSKLNAIELNIENCPAPFWIKRKIENNGLVFNKAYDELINTFKTANDLAESLSSNNKLIRNKAHKLMVNECQHIFKGIGWYLHNGMLIRLIYKNIIFVGRLEYLNNDIEKFNKKILDSSLVKKENYKFNQEVVHLRMNKNNYDKRLSSLAIRNLKKWYSKTDYLALEIMNEYRLIDNYTLEEYKNYKNKI